LIWFHNDAIAMGSDYVAPLHPVDILARLPFAWNTWLDAGTTVSPILNTSLVQIASYSFLVSLGISVSNAQKIFVIVSQFGGALSCNRFTKFVIKGNPHSFVAGLFAALVYLFNPLVFEATYTGWIGRVEVFAATAASSYFVFRGLHERRLLYAVYFGLASFVSFSVYPVSMVATGVFLALLSVVVVIWLIATNSLARKRVSVFSLKFMSVGWGLAVLVNTYWLFPFLANFNLYAPVLASHTTSFNINPYSTLFNALRLYGSWAFYVGNYVPYAHVYQGNLMLILVSIALPLMAFSSILLVPLRKIAIFNILALALVWLAKGANPPFGDWFSTLFSIGPLRVFHDPFVFYSFVLLLYSVMIGAFAGGIVSLIGRLSTKRRLSKRTRIVIMTVAMLVLTSTILVNSWPILSGATFTNWYSGQSGVQVPNGYSSANSFLQEHDQGNVLLVPRFGTYMATEWGYQGSSLFYQSAFSIPLITGSGAQYGVTSASSQNLIGHAYNTTEFAHYALSQNLTYFLTGKWDLAQADSLTLTNGDFPISSTFLSWSINGTISNPSGHEVYYPFQPQDWSQYPTLVIWISGAFNPENFSFGIGDSSGYVGWYTVTGKSVQRIGNWSEIALTIGVPDVSKYNPQRVSALFMRYFPLPDEMSEVQVGGIYLANVQFNSPAWANILTRLGVQYVLLDRSIDSGLYPTEINAPFMSLLENGTLFPERDFGVLSLYRNESFKGIIALDSSIDNLPSGQALSASLLSETASNSLCKALVVNASQYLIEHMGSATPGGCQEPSSSVEILSTRMNSYTIRVHNAHPTILVLSEGFDPRWIASSSSGQLYHFLVDGFTNGWLIENPGESLIVVSFSAPLYPIVGFLASTVGISCAIMLVAWMSRTQRGRLSLRPV